MKPNLGLTDSARHAICELLNAALADEHLLYVKLRNYHWNVTGPHFRMLHELFEEQYVAIADAADEVAERIRAYGERAIGTLAEFQEHGRLHERPGEMPPAEKMVAELCSDHETIVEQLRGDIAKCQQEYQDEGAADLLIGLLNKHTEMAWMLRATVEHPTAVIA